MSARQGKLRLHHKEIKPAAWSTNSIRIKRQAIPVNDWPPEHYGKSTKVFKHNISAYSLAGQHPPPRPER